MANIGPDGHPIPEQQGVVSALIQPISAKDVMAKLGKSFGSAKGVALYLPQFVSPPQIAPGTEVKREDGTVVEGTGDPVPESVVVTQMTLDKGYEAALKVIATQSKMPLNELSVDLLNMAYAVIHYKNKGGTP